MSRYSSKRSKWQSPEARGNRGAAVPAQTGFGPHKIYLGHIEKGVAAFSLLNYIGWDAKECLENIKKMA